MKFYNAFGIKPTNSYVSAGSDYYIPNIQTKQEIEKAYKAFKKSYKKTDDDLNRIIKYFEVIYYDHDEMIDQIPNLVHLYLALYDAGLENIKNNISELDAIKYFCNEFVIYDQLHNKVGIKVNLNDTLFINSGIKIALDTVLSDQVAPNPSSTINALRMLGIGISGLYVNKSGIGNKGWDVRACLVDEDYSGFVHLSMSYTKDLIEDGQNYIYCGDKFVQMMLIPIFHTQYEEVNENEYNNIMENSERGDNGFGSTDNK